MTFCCRILLIVFSSISFCCIGQNSQALKFDDEKVYSLSLKKDIPIASVAIGLTLTHFLLDRNQDVNIDYIMGLNPESVNEFDESATGNFSLKADKASDIFMMTTLAAPVLLMADPKMRKDWKEIGVITAETYLIGLGLVSLTKNLVERPRPLAFNENLSLEDRAEYGKLNSFMSGHTAATAMSTFMMATIIMDYHPDTKWKPLIWTMAAGIPMTTGMLRYKAGKHYMTDILAGYAVGAVTGFAIPRIHKKIKTKIEDRNTEIIEFFEEDLPIH